MVTGLREAIADVERRRKILEVCAPSPDRADEISAQFATRNVSVRHTPLPPQTGDEFVVVRDADGDFLGSLGTDALDAMLSPAVHPPWAITEHETAHDVVFDFLDDTLFSSYDRRQMLATTREIEDRAWRSGAGTLHAGFQTAEALRTQTGVYRRLADRDRLSIHVYVSDRWEADFDEPITVHVESADEIGAFWFVIFDGGGTDLDKCGLVAEERSPGEYYGFWTYDPELVDDLVAYLEARYGSS